MEFKKSHVIEKQQFSTIRIRSNGEYIFHDYKPYEIIDLYLKMLAENEISQPTPFGQLRVKDLRMLDFASKPDPQIKLFTLCILLSLSPIFALIFPKEVILFLKPDYKSVTDEFVNVLLQKIVSLLQEDLQREWVRVASSSPRYNPMDLKQSLPSENSLDDEKEIRPFQLVALEAVFDLLTVDLQKQLEPVLALQPDPIVIKKASIIMFGNLRETQKKVEIVRSHFLFIFKAVNDYYCDEVEVSYTSFESIIDFYTRSQRDINIEKEWAPLQVDVIETKNIIENTLLTIERNIGQMETLKNNLEAEVQELSLLLKLTRVSVLKLFAGVNFATSVASLFAVIAGLFGMNLYCELFNPELGSQGFWILFGLLIGLSLLWMVFVLWYLSYHLHKKTERKLILAQFPLLGYLTKKN